jgi:multicomponent Na+:H+ antiporter subunit F
MTSVALIAEVIIGLAILITAVRLYRGPTLANRVVALDLLGVLAVGFMAAEAVRSGQPSLVDVAIGIAIAAFIATSAFAMLIDRERNKHDS